MQSIKLPRDKKIRLVICDCDGTILDHQKKVDAGLAEVIRRLREKQVQFTLASGRNFYLMQPLLEELAIELPYITDNGGNIYCGKKRLRNNVLPQRDLPLIASWLYRRKIPFMLYTDTTVYTGGKTSILQRFADRLQGLMTITTYHQDMDLSGQPCFKITCDTTDQLLADNWPVEFQDIFLDVLLQPSEGKLYTITSPASSKGNAMIQLADILAISCDEILAFGDNHNDISMLKKAGWGVAVDNSEQDLKEMADEQCGSNEAQGVSKYLKAYLESELL
jgi:Cof subfamily protein (haloacid dehalogenase superfamily)